MRQAGIEFLARVPGRRNKTILDSAPLFCPEPVVEGTNSCYWLSFTRRGQREQTAIIASGSRQQEGSRIRSTTGFSDFSRSTESSLAMQSILLLGGDPKDKRLIVEVGTPKIKGRELELPVTIVIPAADLTPIEQWGGWRVEATLGTAVVDGNGSFSNLAETVLRVTMPKQPGPGDLTRHRMTLKLRRARQRLVFTMRDPGGGATLWGEVEVSP